MNDNVQRFGTPRKPIVEPVRALDLMNPWQVHQGKDVKGGLLMMSSTQMGWNDDQITQWTDVWYVIGMNIEPSDAQYFTTLAEAEAYWKILTGETTAEPGYVSGGRNLTQLRHDLFYSKEPKNEQ